jgi:hypothetical protein
LKEVKLNRLKNLRIWGTFILSALIASILTWQYFHEGVPAHHILRRSDLPAISNWWGLLLIPVLAWITLGKIQERVMSQNSLRRSSLLFFAGLVLGASISIAFNNNYKPFMDNILFVFLGLSLFMPIFMSEFILGFVLAMSLTFGAILPTVFIIIFSLIGFVIFKISRLLWKRLFRSMPNQ